MCNTICQFHTFIIPLLCIFDIRTPLYDTFRRKAILFLPIVRSVRRRQMPHNRKDVILLSDLFLDMICIKFYNIAKMGLEG